MATDGYGPSDLNVVLTRAYTCCASRSMRQVEEDAEQVAKDVIMQGLQKRQRELEDMLQGIEISGGGGGGSGGDNDSVLAASSAPLALRSAAARKSDSRLVLQQSDFSEAIRGYVPAALRGTKLLSSSVRWDDIGGLVDVRRQLKETLELPTIFGPLYKQAPIKLPSGVMLFGPPGCGKTMLAAAVAAECGLNFISVKGPEILDKYIGGSEQNVRDLFARAAAASPSILFFDEFESIAPRRGADSSGVTDRVVNQLLTFLDGVEDRDDVYVMAASSRPDLVDPALLRPGRLDKPLYCNFPGEEERMAIYQAVARNFDLAEDCGVDMLRTCAREYPAFTGADIQVSCVCVFVVVEGEIVFAYCKIKLTSFSFFILCFPWFLLRPSCTLPSFQQFTQATVLRGSRVQCCVRRARARGRRRRRRTGRVSWQFTRIFGTRVMWGVEESGRRGNRRCRRCWVSLGSLGTMQRRRGWPRRDA